MRYTLGIDIGTTGICALAFDRGSGKTLRALNKPNSAKIDSPRSFERAQDPKTIIDTVYSLIAELENEFGLPESVGVTGQMHGIVYIDKNGEAVSPLYTWQDQRASLVMQSGETYVSHIEKATGYTVAAGYGLATHFYNIMNGEVPENANKISTIHDYLVMKLAGLKEPIVHSSDAASLGLFDLENHVFDTDAVDKLGISQSILPAVTSESAVAGYYKENIPVYVAIGDNQASFLGSAGREEGTLLVNVGTGSQVSLIGDLVKSANGIECRPFIDGKYLLVGSSLCGGRAYAILEKFFRDVANMCGADISSAYPFMDKWIEENSTEEKLVVSTLFDGTRQDPGKRGSISSISTTNLTPSAMMNGFMSGISAELHGLYLDICNMQGGAKATRMIGSGNGLRVNKRLCEIVSEMFGMKLELSDTKEEAALGAAFFAKK